MFVKKVNMKKTIILLLLIFSSGFSQEKTTNKDYKPHLERKNEIRIGKEYFSFLIEAERQLNNNISVGIKAKINNTAKNDSNYNNDIVNDEKLYLGLNARYYFKHFITHSFLYLFFDDNVKVRYFTEGNLGYIANKHKYTSRYLDEQNAFILARKDKTENNIVGTVGIGTKLLMNDQFSLDFSFGGGNFFTNNNRYDSYSYVRFGLGYRF